MPALRPPTLTVEDMVFGAWAAVADEADDDAEDRERFDEARGPP
jgi:hypothetical protein